MSSLESLQRQLAALRESITMPDDSREFELLLEDGEDIPPAIQAMIKPSDVLTIRQYPRGYGVLDDVGECEPSCGYVLYPKTGRVVCLYRSGKTQEVERTRR